jgi:FixJ family two-component response regulator
MEPLIAIVDDDRAVRDALQRMLKAHGFATAIFESAEHFLSCSDPVDGSCLIIDVRMPGMTGLGLHDYLVAKGCRIPTILITASPTSGERSRAIAHGAVSYLTKPLDEPVLIETIRRVLGEVGQAVSGHKTDPEDLT